MMKLNKLLLTATVFVQAVLPGFAQVDTTYFDRDWEETTKDKAVYFRPKPQKVGKYYEVRDYYVSTGKLQMLEYCLDDDFSVPDSISKRYFDNGVLQQEYLYEAGKIKGTHYIYYDNGIKAWECAHGGKEFPRKFYRRSGELWYIETRNKWGKYEGDRIYYYADGKTERKEKWKNGRLKKGVCYTRSGADTSYFPHYAYPEFKGGQKGYRQYERSHLRYNNDLRAEQIEGTVTMDVTVDERGKVVAVVSKKAAHPALVAEARRFLYNTPEWETAFDENYQPIKSTIPFSIDFTAIGGGAFFLTPVDYLLYHIFRVDN